MLFSKVKSIIENNFCCVFSCFKSALTIGTAEKWLSETKKKPTRIIMIHYCFSRIYRPFVASIIPVTSIGKSLC